LDNEKLCFKTQTRDFIENTIKPEYKNGQITDEVHVKNIFAISDFTKQFYEILSGGYLNFGVSQKLLNLHLKYSWCLG
jgi:hypothetical protein